MTRKSRLEEALMTFLLWVCEAHCLPRAAGAEVRQVWMRRGPGCGEQEPGGEERPTLLVAEGLRRTEHIPAHQ